MPARKSRLRYAMNKSQRASETQSIDNTTTLILRTPRYRGRTPSTYARLIAAHGGLPKMKETLSILLEQTSDPTRKLSPSARGWVERTIAIYERAVKSSIGMPTYADSSTLQREAPSDIPTLPLSTYQLIERTCLVEKLASAGTTAGGFYASLTAGDLTPFTGTNKLFRLNRVTSWTVPRADGSGNSGFAGVSVPAATGSTGDNILPIWSENFTPIGQGYAGIVTQFPLGDFPLYSAVESTLILNHFTALGGSGGVTGVIVVFHCVIETLI